MTDGRLQCKLDHKVVELLDVTDQFKASVIRHEYVGHNGAELEWMGMGANEYRFRASFAGEAFELYPRFLQACSTGKMLQVIHPIYGALDGLVEDVSVKHDDHTDKVDVDFTFVQEGLDKTLRFRADAKDVIAAKAQAVADAAYKEAAKAFYPNKPPAPDLSDPDWFDKLSGLSNKVLGVVSEMKNAMGRIDAVIAAVGAPLSALAGAIDFVQDLPGAMIDKVTQMVDVLTIVPTALDRNASLDAQAALDTLRNHVEKFRGTIAENPVRALAAFQGVRLVSAMMDGDLDTLRTMQAYERSESFDAQGNWVGESSTAPSLPASSDQVGRLVNASRTEVRTASAYLEDSEALFAVALALLRQYRDRLVEFENIREIEVKDPIPLHLLCLRLGLPYNMAERLVLINDIRNPSFVQGKVRVYA